MCREHNVTDCIICFGGNAGKNCAFTTFLEFCQYFYHLLHLAVEFCYRAKSGTPHYLKLLTWGFPCYWSKGCD
ncbi:hypothetical protein AOLI_G00215870 [Acnodon oligacanthus]